MRWIVSTWLALALTGGAQAACKLESFTSQLPEYNALITARGSLNITVSCENPNDPFQLFLSGPVPTEQPSPTISIPFTQGSAILRTSLSGDLKQLRGQVLRGSQTLTFPLEIVTNQWSHVGAYHAQLSLMLLNQP